MAVRGGGGHHNVSDFGHRARKEVLMESSNLVLEKSWKSHGILFSNFSGNPE